MAAVCPEISKETAHSRRSSDCEAFFNPSAKFLADQAVGRGECKTAPGGALLAYSGKKTGRSPKDKYVVAGPEPDESIWWKHQKPMTADEFSGLRRDLDRYLSGKKAITQDLTACADPAYRLNVRVVCELAWQALAIRHLLRAGAEDRQTPSESDWTIVCCPDFSAAPGTTSDNSGTVIALNFAERTVLICGTGYAGEIKKSVFTVLNYILPRNGVLSMHCAANHAPGNPDDAALFFGLSGTGKTTLSADPQRILVGDDEHGWSDGGIFNFEGGCYAKTLNLNGRDEPEIFATTSMFGTILENVAFDKESKSLDFTDGTLTENGRCAYPLKHIPFASPTGRAGHPKHIVMLTCDSFGVLPPIARLDSDQAAAHFLSGFTSKVGGTERSVSGVQPVFSPCFGHPFLPLKPEIYGRLFREKLQSHGPACWLVNTGWTGGPYGVGRRIEVGTTRALVKAALDGAFSEVEFRRDPNFGFQVPVDTPGLPSNVLNPKATWDDPDAYDIAAARLAASFEENAKTLGQA